MQELVTAKNISKTYGDLKSAQIGFVYFTAKEILAIVGPQELEKPPCCKF